MNGFCFSNETVFISTHESSSFYRSKSLTDPAGGGEAVQKKGAEQKILLSTKRGKEDVKYDVETEDASDWSWKVISVVLVPPLDHTSAVDLEMTSGRAGNVLLC